MNYRNLKLGELHRLHIQDEDLNAAREIANRLPRLLERIGAAESMQRDLNVARARLEDMQDRLEAMAYPDIV